ncbi:MAG: DUF366 family protein [Calothrix sp. SM1_5_4]|nr:DUF366 family protein [Calothrix sp. SM1_5_4]
MKFKFLSTNEAYDGTQLVSLRSYLSHGLLGDSIVAWVGPCEIRPEHMVDGEDLVQNAQIRGDGMLHFIVEIFDSTLFAAVGLQRLLASMVKDELMRTASASHREIVSRLTRSGDDLYGDGKKLSISIATQSPVSSLIHFAVNVVNEGTPVPTLALKDLGVEPRPLAEAVMAAFAEEVRTIRLATQKVRWVR